MVERETKSTPVVVRRPSWALERTVTTARNNIRLIYMSFGELRAEGVSNNDRASYTIGACGIHGHAELQARVKDSPCFWGGLSRNSFVISILPRLAGQNRNRGVLAIGWTNPASTCR